MTTEPPSAPDWPSSSSADHGFSTSGRDTYHRFLFCHRSKPQNRHLRPFLLALCVRDPLDHLVGEHLRPQVRGPDPAAQGWPLGLPQQAGPGRHLFTGRGAPAVSQNACSDLPVAACFLLSLLSFSKLLLSPPLPLRAGGLTGAIMERVNGSGHRPAASTQGPWPACRAETVGAPALGRVATANFGLRRRPGRGALRLDGSTCVPWPVLPERPFRGRVRVSVR